MIKVSVSIETDSRPITRKFHEGSHNNYDFVNISEARFLLSVRLCVAELLSGNRIQI